MKTIAMLAAAVLAALGLSSCGPYPAASALDKNSYSSDEKSSGVPFLGKNCAICNMLTGGRSSWR